MNNKIKLPESVRVGFRTYKISELGDPGPSIRPNHFGWQDYDGARIIIETDTDCEMQAQVLLHEILHACWKNGELPKKHEEHIVSVLSHTLTQVFQDNPEVMDWIGNHARGI